MSKAATIEIQPGELYDRVTILGLKIHHATDADVIEALHAQADDLGDKWKTLNPPKEVVRLSRKLADVNKVIWDAETSIRDCEARKDFGDRFTQLARAVYQNNDQRAKLKQAINAAMNADDPMERKYHR